MKPEAAQTNSKGAFAESLPPLLPVLIRPVGARDHVVCLLAQKVNPSNMEGVPSGTVVISRCHSTSFRVFAEREPFIPASGEIKKMLQRLAHNLEARIRSCEKKRQSGHHS